MDIHKFAHDVSGMFRDGHLHLPLFAGLIGVMGKPKQNHTDEISDLGEVPGDNILPNEILISLSSRRGL